MMTAAMIVNNIRNIPSCRRLIDHSLQQQLLLPHFGVHGNIPPTRDHVLHLIQVRSG